MVIEAVLMGLLIGTIRKGKISRLQYLKINLSPLIILSLISYLAIIIMNLGLFDFNSNLYHAFLIATYVFIIVVLTFNLDKKFIFMPLIGAMLNFICICVNSFKVPVKSEIILKLYGEEMNNLLIGNKIKYFITSENAKLNILGKIFSISDYYFYDIILSIGDIVIALGIVLIIQELMTDKYLKTKDSITLSKSLYKKKKKD